MANMNPASGAQVCVFENGGTLTFTKSATTHTVLNIEKGTLEYEPGSSENLHYNDRGVPQSPLRGDGKITKIKFTVKHTSGTGSTELETLAALGHESGLVPQFSVSAFFPAHRGATTGKRVTFPNAVFAGRRVRTGDFDMLEIELEDINPEPTVASS